MTYRPPKRIEELKATALRILINKLYHPVEGLEALVLESALEEAVLHVQEMEREVGKAEHDVIHVRDPGSLDRLEARAVQKRCGLHQARERAQRLIEAIEPFRLRKEIRDINEQLEELYRTANAFEFLLEADAILPGDLTDVAARQAERRQHAATLHQRINELSSQLRHLPSGPELLQSLDLHPEKDL